MLEDVKRQPAAPKETFARFQAGFLSSEDFHRFLWIFIGFHNFSWILMDFHVFRGVETFARFQAGFLLSEDFHRFLLIFIDLYDFYRFS